MTTCALAGFEDRRVVDPDLQEWDYGAYEGLTTKQIHADKPSWELFRDGCPKGEFAADVGARADAVIARIRKLNGSVLLFSSSHFLRVLGVRWVDLTPEDGARLVLDTASISVLGYEHNLNEPVIRRWNQR
jgi:probable phosphoglycerate mutase